MGEVLIWKLFNQLAINPFVWGEKTDDEIVRQALEIDLPQICDYLESQVPPDGFLFGAPGVADVSLAVFFRNAGFVRYRVDPARWPRTAAFVERVLGHDALARLRPFEEETMRTPPGEHRAALAALGAPLTAETYATSAPRRGMMRI
jgi:hypothetical protein